MRDEIEWLSTSLLQAPQLECRTRVECLSQFPDYLCTWLSLDSRAGHHQHWGMSLGTSLEGILMLYIQFGKVETVSVY